MILQAFLIGAMTAASLAMPHHGFLHEVDFPGAPPDSNKTEPIPTSVAPSSLGASGIVKRDVDAEGDGLDGVAIQSEADKVNVSVITLNAAPDLAIKQDANVSTPSNVSSPESTSVEPSTTANSSEPGPADAPVDPSGIVKRDVDAEGDGLDGADIQSEADKVNVSVITSNAAPDLAIKQDANVSTPSNVSSPESTSVEPSTTANSSEPGPADAPVDPFVAYSRKIRSITEIEAPLEIDVGSAETPSSSRAESVDSIKSTSPAAAVDASSTSPGNPDLLSKERLLRSIIEQSDMTADVDEQSTSKSVKCQCPSGECSGEVCLLMDLTSIASNKTEVPTASSLELPGNQTRNARSVPEQAMLDMSTASTVNSSVSTAGVNISNNASRVYVVSEVSTYPAITETTLPETTETKAPVAESHIQKIQPRPVRGIPDGTTAGTSNSPDQASTNQQVSKSLDPKSVTLNENATIEDPKPQQNVHAEATIESTATTPDQINVNRRKRAPQEALDELVTLSDGEMTKDPKLVTLNENATIEDPKPQQNVHAEATIESTATTPDQINVNRRKHAPQEALDELVTLSDGEMTKDPKLVTLNENATIEDPKPQQNVHAEATIESTATTPDQINVNRQKRAPQEALDELITLSDEEMTKGTTEPTTTLKLAADTPEDFSVEPVLLDRSRRLYKRSVPGTVVSDAVEPKSVTPTQNETTPGASEPGSPLPTVAPLAEKEVVRNARQAQVSTNIDESTSTGADQGSAVSPSVTGVDQTSGKAPESANTNQVPAGGDSGSAQVSSASPDVPVTRSDQALENDSKAELPKDILPNAENGLKNEENELARTRYVHSIQARSLVGAISSAASPGPNQVLAKENVEQVAEAETSGAKSSNTPAEPVTRGGEPLDEAGIQNGDTKLKAKHARAVDTKPNEIVASSSAKTDVSNASTVAETAAVSPELLKQNEVNKTGEKASAAKAVGTEVAANSTGVAANATEVAGNSTEISTNATKLVARDTQSVIEPSTSAPESPASSQSAAATQSVSNPPESGGEPLDEAGIQNGDTKLKAKHARAVDTKPNEIVASSSAKTDVSNASTVAETVAISPELLKQKEVNKTGENASAAKAVGTAANATEVAANSTGVAANATEVAGNLTEISTNATKVEARETQNVTKPSTSAPESPASSQSAAATLSVSNPPESGDHFGGVISHRKFFRPISEGKITEKQTTSRGERKIQEKQEAANEQETRRLGKSTDGDDLPDLGPLDIRTMGGNQLDIDPVELDSDHDSAKSPASFQENLKSQSNHLSASAFLPLTALLSSLLSTLAAYLST